MNSTRSLLETRCIAVITTNCDRIIETCAAGLGAPTSIFVNDADLATFHTTPCTRLIKLHGSLDQMDSLVFTREQYAAHAGRVPGIRNRVAELMRSSKVLFIGFSMADPDFLDLMQLVGKGNPDQLAQMVGLFSATEIREGWRKLHLDEKVRKQAPLLEIAYEDFGASPSEAITAFLSQLRDLISPQTLPRLQCQSILFMNGYTATLKTELSTYLANCLSIPLLATHRYGDCTVGGILNSDKRSARYSQLLEDAERVVLGGRSVILDGTFAEPEWRTAVYRLAENSGAHPIAIQTRCEDDTYIRARLWRRFLDHSRSEHEVTKYENFQITRAAIEANPVEADSEFTELGGEIIRFENHGDKSVHCESDASADVRTISDLIKIGPLMSIHI